MTEPKLLFKGEQDFKVPQKVCRQCKKIKPITNFNRRNKSAFMKRNTADGRRNICRDCANHYQRIYKAERRKESLESS
jgi:hypothetical protein